ncbi:MAG: hypothetical protein H6656_15760 [Ardenticatenaceae bacterium]|nr:hypothetical protein [Ardenticatenaceae bacterium]
MRHAKHPVRWLLAVPHAGTPGHAWAVCCPVVMRFLTAAAHFTTHRNLAACPTWLIKQQHPKDNHNATTRSNLTSVSSVAN